MTRPRLAHSLVASTAAAALALAGVLVGAAPVSASSPVSAAGQSDVCLDALDAFEDEFGDIDFDDLDGLDEILNDLLEEFFAQTEDLFAELEDLYEQVSALGGDADAETIADALAGPRAAAEKELADAKAALEAAQPPAPSPSPTDESTDVPSEVPSDVPTDVPTEDPTDGATDGSALEELEKAVESAQAHLDEIDGIIKRGNEIEAELERIFVEDFEPRLEELLGDLDEIDLERFLELVTIILTECDLEGEDSDDSDDTDDTAGGGTAPVATPVKGRASFTG